MIDETKILKKMSKIIRDSDIKAISDVLIERYDNGVYHLFEKYQIKKIKGVYVIDCLTHADELYFYALKNAVAWCTYDKRNRINDSERILHLDIKLSGIEAEIEVHQKLVKRTKKTEEKLIYLAKLGEEKMERKRINDELTGYVYNSRNWQENRFHSKSE
jgi:hypothetical protein